MKFVLPLVALLVLVYSFTPVNESTRADRGIDLRALYSSGDPSTWPEAHLFEEAREGFQDIGPLPKPKFPKDNPYSKEKEELGKTLFFDPRLSESGQISCASCHDPELMWADARRVAYGHDRQLGIRNTPTLVNIAYATSLFWDGRAKDLEDQVKFPIENPVEMNIHSKLAVKRIAKIKAYRPLFEEAFGEGKITQDKIDKAIATFERTLLSPATRFDQFVKGKKDALSDSEVRGLHLFRTKANCINCHNTPYFSDQKFHNVGLTYFDREYEDLGRYEISKNKEDVGKFKTPSLREISHTAPYMHNGLFPDIRGVLNMYNAGMPNEKWKESGRGISPEKSGMLTSLNLSETELVDLENFLKSLHSLRYKMRAPELPK
ncbi:cytochrome-c peroxidase [Chryseobacterium sp. A301]